MNGRSGIAVCVLLSWRISLALTGGPSMPEYTSFEPGNGGTKVDLSTGDLTYMLPLFTVPGPSGGFPIALSYHSGIKHGQTGSWTGLGWGLNAGSINRQIRGVPDDFFNALVYSDAYDYNTGSVTVEC